MNQLGPKGLILWILLAAGTFLVYCAYKGYTPQSVLTNFLNRDVPPVPFGHSATTDAATSGYTGGGSVQTADVRSPNSSAPKSAIKVQNA